MQGVRKKELVVEHEIKHDWVGEHTIDLQSDAVLSSMIATGRYGLKRMGLRHPDARTSKNIPNTNSESLPR